MQFSQLTCLSDFYDYKHGFVIDHIVHIHPIYPLLPFSNLRQQEAIQVLLISFCIIAAKEVNRVAMLNVLGKSIKNLREPLTHPDQSSK